MQSAHPNLPRKCASLRAQTTRGAAFRAGAVLGLRKGTLIGSCHCRSFADAAGYQYRFVASDRIPCGAASQTGLAKTLSDVKNFMERGTSPSTGSSTPPRYSPGALTPQTYSPGTLKNAECSNCKHLLDKITVLEATVDMYMHPKQHTINSAALFHKVYNNMGKRDLE
ncbi:hypothetical protein Tco_1040267 [Tanacetum coccineum]